MTNEFLTQLSNTGAESEGNFAELDSLFGSARQSEPLFAADNFTKQVLNSIPCDVKRPKQSSISIELIGILLGLIAAYFTIDFNSLVAGALNLVPESVTLAPVHMLFALAAVSVMSALAWWVVEKGQGQW